MNQSGEYGPTILPGFLHGNFRSCAIGVGLALNLRHVLREVARIRRCHFVAIHAADLAVRVFMSSVRCQLNDFDVSDANSKQTT